MTRGWFDAFRENGGPTLYSYSNRTAVTADVATLTLYRVFVTLFVAFVSIFPGVRRQRFTTFTSVTLSLFVGTAILGINSINSVNEKVQVCIRMCAFVNYFSWTAWLGLAHCRSQDTVRLSCIFEGKSYGNSGCQHWP